MIDKYEYLQNITREVVHLRNLFNYAHAGLLVNYAPNSEDECKQLVSTIKRCQILEADIEKLLEDLRELDQRITFPYMQ